MALSKSQRKQLAPVFKDPIKFFRLLRVQDKYSGAYKQFDLYPEQETLLRKLSQHQKIIVIKPRQIGVSTLLRAYAYYRAYTAEDPVKFGVLSFHNRIVVTRYQLLETFILKPSQYRLSTYTQLPGYFRFATLIRRPQQRCCLVLLLDLDPHLCSFHCDSLSMP